VCIWAERVATPAPRRGASGWMATGRGWQPHHPPARDVAAKLRASTGALFGASVVEDQSWRRLGRRLGVASETARERVVAAIAALSLWLRCEPMPAAPAVRFRAQRNELVTNAPTDYIETTTMQPRERVLPPRGAGADLASGRDAGATVQRHCQADDHYRQQFSFWFFCLWQAFVTCSAARWAGSGRGSAHGGIGGGLAKARVGSRPSHNGKIR
jgi:hypothetical protein